jgi:NO-binding membrane sensor protein with MHYT domain
MFGSRVQIVAILVTAGLFLVVFELVRRRRLMERYALLWLVSAAILLGLSVWRDALEGLSSAIGIYYAPSAFFVAALAAILAMLLHFSLVISRMADQVKVLAQRLAAQQARIDQLEAAAQASEPRDLEAPID